MTVDMNKAMCSLLRLELQLFGKIKNFYMNQVQVLPPKRLNAITRAIREEFPIDKFNEHLQDSFDACMAQSEASVNQATEYTLGKYKEIETWQDPVTEKNLPGFHLVGIRQ